MRSSVLRGHWTQAGARFGDEAGYEVVLGFRGIEEEVRASHWTAGVVDRSAMGVLIVRGDDRKAFLHRVCTNHTESMNPGDGRYACFLSRKAKMQSDATIVARSDELLVSVEPGRLSEGVPNLTKLLLRAKVTLHDETDQWCHLGVYGPQAPGVVARATAAPPSAVAALTEPNAIEAGTPDRPVLIVASRLTGHPGFEIFTSLAGAEVVTTALESHGAIPIGTEALEVLRVEAGRPRYGQDMDEETIPVEAGIQDRAIDYAKGCYIGQETIARIRTYGQVAKVLRGLVFEDVGELPPTGLTLHVGTEDVGILTSIVRSPKHGVIGLGYVRRKHDTPGVGVTVSSGGKTWPAKVRNLPFTVAS